MHQTFPKPSRGTALLQRRERHAKLKAHEKREMDAAKRRDRMMCRVPGCEMHKKRMPMHAAHLEHRGMGGNPSGERTEVSRLITLCAFHHGEFDRSFIDIQPQSILGANGCCDFHKRSESGRWELVDSERTIGISVERSQR